METEIFMQGIPQEAMEYQKIAFLKKLSQINKI
jgi:hypothetical protein